MIEEYRNLYCKIEGKQCLQNNHYVTIAQVDFFKFYCGGGEQGYKLKYIAKPYSAFLPTELKDRSPRLKA